MSWIEGAGYFASILVFSTFYMKTMIPLRCIAIASNFAFITYGFFGNLYPVLILHILLLPLNVLRLLQMHKLISEVKEARKGEFSLDGLIPFMTQEKFRKGDVVFRQGDKANKLYILRKGSIRFPEIEVDISENAVIGEIGIFSSENKRTASAICKTNVELWALTNEKVLQLYFQDPRFGFYLIQLIIHRLVSNLDVKSSD